MGLMRRMEWPEPRDLNSIETLSAYCTMLYEHLTEESSLRTTEIDIPYTDMYNVFLGHEAAMNNTVDIDAGEGIYNVYAGHQAGYANIVGSGGVYLGHKAGYNETTSNKLYIDNSDTTTPLIYGDFDNDFITINGDLRIASNKELRLYDNGNYVGLEAPALTADKVWVLPSADADTANKCLKSDSSGNLGWSQALGTGDSPTFGGLTLNGNLLLRSNNELRFYDNGNYVGFEAPALGADCIWVLPTADGAAGEHMVSDGSKNLSWTTGAGTGNVIASGDFGTDNVILRSDGVAKGCQHTGIVIDNSDNISFVGTIGCYEITVANGHGINLQEDITFTGATTVNQIKFPDALANALAFKEAGNIYQQFVTTNGSEAVYFAKYVGLGTITPSAPCHARSVANKAVLKVENAHAGLTAIVASIDAARAANPGYDLLRCTADAVSQFRVQGDGTTTIAGNVTLSSATSTITGGTKLTLAAGASGVCIDDKFSLGAGTELTIAGGAITVTKSFHRVDGQGDASDNLDTINGGVDGMELVLMAENPGRDITVRDGEDNIELEGGVNMVLSTLLKKLYLFYDAQSLGGKWCERSRFNG